MKLCYQSFVLTSLFAAIAACCFWASTPPTRAASPIRVTEDAVAVEPEMHDFMEGYFQPSYKRIKEAMAAEPKDRQGWGVIRAEALVLAESGNLLLIRQPEKDVADWIKQSVQVRESGGEFYKAAKAKDFAAARKHYEAMIENCNACHRQFANGKHILKP